MKLFGKDTFNVEVKQKLNDEQVSSLSFFYSSLLNDGSLRLYLFLYSTISITNRQLNHLDISKYLNMNIDDIEKARKELEEVGLLKSYVKENVNSNSYLYSLNAPNSPNEFLNNEILSRIFVNRFGNDDYKSFKIDNYSDKDSEKYTEITSKMGFSFLQDWNEKQEDEYQQSNNDTQFKDYAFDLEQFNRKINILTFPNELRTIENIRQICSLGELYGISPEEMHNYVYKSIKKDGPTQFLDLDRLKYYCLKSETIYHYERLGDGQYDISPVAFLKTKQNGISKVASSDAKLLDELIHEWKLPIPVCNVLVEYTLDKCQGKLTRSFIEKIGSSFIRNGIDTVDKALQQLNIKIETNEKIVQEETELSNEEVIKMLKEGLRNG